MKLKVKIPVKNGPNSKRLATFLRVVLCSQAAILYSSILIPTRRNIASLSLFGTFVTRILTFKLVKDSVSFNFMFFYKIRHNPSLSDPLAVRVVLTCDHTLPPFYSDEKTPDRRLELIRSDSLRYLLVTFSLLLDEFRYSPNRYMVP